MASPQQKTKSKASPTIQSLNEISKEKVKEKMTKLQEQVQLENSRSSDSESTTSMKRELFQTRPSLLDEFEEESEIRKSKFRGVFMALYLLMFSFLLAKPIQNYIKHGQLFSSSLFDNFKHDFFLCIITWPLYYIWSYSAFILQKLIIFGLNNKLVVIYQLSTQLAIFFYAVYMIFSRDWCSTHATFSCFLACSHFMKMHSYTQINKKYREIYLRSKKSSAFKSKVAPPKNFIVDPVNNGAKLSENGSVHPEQVVNRNDKKKQNKQTKHQLTSADFDSDNDNECNSKEECPYPHNITFTNFTTFMWMPTLLYQHTYPRSPKVRLWYVISKSFLTASCILAGYTIWTDYVMPVIHEGHKIHWIDLVFQLMLPLGAFNMTIFYIVFENILGVFAEISRFGDRKFFDDWWNCTSFEEYNRKWNRPVHLFLYTHVYLECLENYKTSRLTAQIFTFFFSALLHEWVCAMVFRVVRPILFGFMLFQIPLFFMMKPFKGSFIGNAIFWHGMFLGPALIISGYLRSDKTVTSYFSYEYYNQ